MRLSPTHAMASHRRGLRMLCWRAAAAARSPVRSRRRAPRRTTGDRNRERKTSPPQTGRRTTERSRATGSRRSTRSTAATSRSFASCAPTRCPRCPRCRPARSSSTARCTSRRKGARTRSTRPRARRSGASSRQSSRPSPLGVQRGFAYLDGRLFRGTSDAHVLALDAADGHTLWDVDDGRGGDAGRLDADGADRRERHGLHRQRGRRPDRRHRARLRARRARRPRRLAVRRGARRARGASDLAERGPLSDHGRRVLDVVRARHANAACSTCRRAIPRPTSTWKPAAATTCTRTR